MDMQIDCLPLLVSNTSDTVDSFSNRIEKRRKKRPERERVQHFVLTVLYLDITHELTHYSC